VPSSTIAARVTPQPWVRVIEFYGRLADRNDDFTPMHLLAEHIARQPYAVAIFGATSGTALLVAPRAEPDWTQDVLRIGVDLSGKIRFALQSRRPTHRVAFQAEARTIVQAFDGFLRNARWA
jgi:hypothetical protein